MVSRLMPAEPLESAFQSVSPSIFPELGIKRFITPGEVQNLRSDFGRR